jgi:lipopolysaccharide export LptBFGC system permease protein LptF
MTTLDRYIVRQFLANFAVLSAVLLSLFVVVDLMVDLDEFLQAGDAHADQWFGSKWLAVGATTVDFYGPMVLLIYVFFSGLIVAGAMGFTVSHLQRQRELTAIIASGVSLYRVAMPIVIVGVALSASALPLQEFLLPRMATQLTRSKSDLKRETGGGEKPIRYIPDDVGNLWSATGYDPTQQRLTDLRVVVRNDKRVLDMLITADEAYWSEDHGGWRLVQANVRQPVGEAGSAVEEVIAPEILQTKLTPAVLLARRATLFPAVLSLRELQTLQSNDAVDAKQRGVITRTIWGRFSLLVLNVLLLVMALPFFLRRLPGNPLMPSAQAAGLCVGAWAGGLIMLQASPEAVSPVVSAWLPVVIYLPISAILVTSIKT